MSTADSFQRGIFHCMVQRDRPRKKIKRHHLPNEILHQVIELFDPGIDKKVFLNLRLSCSLLNVIASDRLLKFFSFDIGNSAEDVFTRSFSMLHSPFSQNIQGLILTAACLVSNSFKKRPRSVGDQYRRAIRSGFKDSLLSRFCGINASVSQLVSKIGPQIQLLDLKLHNDDDREGQMVAAYFARFIANILSTAHQDMPNLKSLSLEVWTIQPELISHIQAGAVTSHRLGYYENPLQLLRIYNPREGSEDAQCLDQWALGQYTKPAILNLLERLYITAVPTSFQRDKQYEIGDSQINDYYNLKQLFGLACACPNLTTLSFKGANCFLKGYNKSKYQKLLRLSLSDLTCDFEWLTDSSRYVTKSCLLSSCSKTLTNFELSNINSSQFYSDVDDDAPKFVVLFKFIEKYMLNITHLRIRNLRYVVYRSERRCCVTSWAIPETMSLFLGKTGYERPMFTPHRRDLDEFITLRDQLIQRRADRGMGKDHWLEFCVEYEEDISEQIQMSICDIWERENVNMGSYGG